MDAEGFVVHYTLNDATAEEEISNMHRNGNYTSFHYDVDEKEIVQGIDENRNSYNAGDGRNGAGNRKYISIEICRSYSKKKVNGKWVADEEKWRKNYKEKFEQAQRNAAEFIAFRLKEKGWGIERVKKHQDFSGKHCPHRTLDDYGWQYFLDLVQSYLNPKPVIGPGTVAPSKIKDGDLVSIKKDAVYSTGKKVPSWVQKQKWYVDAVVGNRVVINKNEQGTNAINSAIDASYLTVVANKKSVEVGSKVKVRNGATTYVGGSLKPFVYKRTYKVKELKKDRAVITYLGVVTAAVNVKDLILV
jgi:N-acetylmuramoyl-L-alanine amidase CwlA